jgi:alkanesulfonate monooxygenase SsuD/methylene tetrahydromethanopterin reductase-like flavin-dependent oxidoreductase (luciferase family)
MTTVSLRFDMRGPAFGTPHTALYKAAVEMAEYGDRHGFQGVVLSEHHGVADGYLPSPIVLASAMAARTRSIQFQLMAIIAPLHDPLRLAEDIAILDQISQGRVLVTIAGGYVASEFAMFGKEMTDRGKLVEEAIATLKAAWTGESFQYRGRTVRVTPKPVQHPHPLLFMGGSAPAAAKRAGRLADGFVTHREDLYQVYFDEAKAHGKNPFPFSPSAPGFLYVAEDPEAAWRVIAPHAVHEMNSYGEWIAASGTDGRFAKVESADEAKASGGYVIVTPDECVALAKSYRNLVLHPLMAGLDPDFGWQGLELFVNKVLPRI